MEWEDTVPQDQPKDRVLPAEQRFRDLMAITIRVRDEDHPFPPTPPAVPNTITTSLSPQGTPTPPETAANRLVMNYEATTGKKVGTLQNVRLLPPGMAAHVVNSESWQSPSADQVQAYKARGGSGRLQTIKRTQNTNHSLHTIDYGFPRDHTPSSLLRKCFAAAITAIALVIPSDTKADIPDTTLPTSTHPSTP